jgi:nitrite reductase/ring-hydroxylating ferredoxin subunit
MLSNLRLKNVGTVNWFGSDSKGYYRIAEINELSINEMKSLKVKGKEILLCRSEGGYYAFQLKCSYKNDPLTRGVMISGIIQCLNHGCQFDVESGAVRKGPAKKALRRYQVFERDNGVYLKF